MTIILNRINKKFISKKIFVENHFIKKQLKEISSLIKVVGNIRINKQKITKRVNKNNIYYISEMHNLNLLNYKIQKILYTFKDKNLFIRLHPGKLNIQAKIVSKNIDYNKRLFIDNTSSITKAIQHIKPLLVFTSTPTVYNELIANKIKTILIKDSSFYTNYPLEIDHKKIFSTTDFNINKYKGRLHKVPTKYFDKISEYKIYNYFNE